MHFERKESEGSIMLKGCKWEKKEATFKKTILKNLFVTCKVVCYQNMN